MRKQFIPVALFAVLATMAVSCQKENVMDFAPETTVSEAGTVYTVQYAVNGVLHSITISNDSEWDAFMQTVFALSREGYDVRIMDENRPANGFSTKDTQVYTTSSEANASTWTKEKVKTGYQVSISYDETSGVYTCVAQK